MNLLQLWLSKATPAEKRELAAKAVTTPGALRQAAGGYRHSGKLSLTPEFAKRLELASKKHSNKELPILWREKLSLTCGSCEYFKKCKREG